MNDEHEFGGSHTEEKLSLIVNYLNFYSSALKNKGFYLTYIDAFAGTGRRSLKVEGQPLFNAALSDTTAMQLDGSARLALQVQPPLHKLIFIDRMKKHVQSLLALKNEVPNRNVDVFNGDANILVKKLCAEIQWRGPNAPGMGVRAVLFLDPYGMQVEWDTLETIRKTKAIDLWYLLNVEAICRQAGHTFEKIDTHKKNALDRSFGNRERWERICYEKPDTGDLFGYMDRKIRIALPEFVATSFVQEMRNAGYGYVHEPYPIMDGSRYKFALIFAVANTNGKAIGLAKKAAKSILKPKR